MLKAAIAMGLAIVFCSISTVASRIHQEHVRAKQIHLNKKHSKIPQLYACWPRLVALSRFRLTPPMTARSLDEETGQMMSSKFSPGATLEKPVTASHLQKF